MAKLTFKDRFGRDQVLTFRQNSGAVRVGRIESFPICTNDPSVSRDHGQLRWNAGHYEVLDHGSTNGTKLNNGPNLQPNIPVPIKDNDIVYFGSFPVRFNEEIEDRYPSSSQPAAYQPPKQPSYEQVSLEKFKIEESFKTEIELISQEKVQLEQTLRTQHSALEEYETTITKLENRISLNNDLMDSLVDKYEVLKEESERNKAELAKYRRQQGTEDDELFTVQTEFDELKSKYQQAEKTIDELEHSNRNLKSRLEDYAEEDFDKRLAVVQFEYQEIQDKYEILQKDHEHLQDLHRDFEREVSELRSRLERRESTIDELENSLKATERENALLNTRLDSFGSAGDSEIALAELRADLSAKDREMRKLRNEIEDLTEQLNQYKDSTIPLDEHRKVVARTHELEDQIYYLERQLRR